MPLERWPIASEAEWLSWRKKHVTASTVGALFGCHTYCSALRLYMEKAGVELPAPASPVLRRGRLLESSVAAAVAEQRPSWQLEKCGHYYVDTDARLACTPDYLIHGDPRGPGILQCKTSAPSTYKRDWTETAPPFWIVLQTLTEVMLTGAAFGVVAALVVDPFNLDCPLYDIPRHPASEQRIRAAVAKFWDDFAAGREPGPDYGLDRDLIAMLAPKEAPGKTVNLFGDNEVMAALNERADLKDRIKRDEARCDVIEAMIMHKIGDAETVVGIPDFRVTWKTQHRKEYTVKGKDNRVLRILDKRPDRGEAA
jgi:predicted phage-related endonuclease